MKKNQPMGRLFGTTLQQKLLPWCGLSLPWPFLPHFLSSEKSHELLVLIWPICSLYECTLRKRRRTLWLGFMEENKLMIVPMDNSYIIHATSSGPKDVYIVNERRDGATT